MSAAKKLYRSRDQKMIAGICGGIAEYFDVDPTLVRIATVVLAFAWGSSVLAYIILWIVIPEEPLYTTVNPVNPPASADPFQTAGSQNNMNESSDSSQKNDTPNTEAPKVESEVYNASTPYTTPPITTPQYQGHGSRFAVFVGIFFILFGGLALVSRFFGGIDWWNLWPLLIVAGGVIQCFTPESYRKPWTPWRILNGLTTITIGGVLFGCTTGWVSWDIFWRFLTLWPLLIVAAGLAIMGGSLKQNWLKALGNIVVIGTMIIAAALSFTGPLPSNWQANSSEALTSAATRPFAFSEPRGAVKTAKLDFENGVGENTIKGASGNKLIEIEGKTRSIEPDFFVNRSDDSATVSLKDSSSKSIVPGPNSGNNTDIALSDNVAWTLAIESGVSQSNYDFSAVDVVSAKIDTGVSDSTIKLGRPSSSAQTVSKNMVIEAGVGRVVLSVPRNVPVHIVTDTGLWNNRIDGFAKQNDGSYQNEQYSRAMLSSVFVPVWNIEISGGVGEFSVEQY